MPADTADAKVATGKDRPDGRVGFMVEHPGWIPNGDHHIRVMRVAGQKCAYLWLRDGAVSVRPSEHRPERDEFSLRPSLGNRLPRDLAAALRSLGKVVRYRNGSLWDALVTAVMRQVIRAPQSRAMYRRLCSEFGEEVVHPCGTTYALTPGPSVILQLTEDDFSRTGMAFKRRALRAAAKAYLDRERRWQPLEGSQLVRQLCDVSGIGPWTAGAAVADWRNDWSIYPYEDLAVRTWAAKAAPSFPWPKDEQAFAAVWQDLGREELGNLTLLTLAWGSQRGVIG